MLVSVAGHESSTGPAPVAGVLLALASGTTYALTTVAGGSISKAGLAARAHERDDAGRGASPCCRAWPWSTGRCVTADPAALAWLVYLGALTMALAYVLLYSGLRVVAPSTAVTASLVEPVTAAVVAAVVLSEALGPAAVVGHPAGARRGGGPRPGQHRGRSGAAGRRGELPSYG